MKNIITGMILVTILTSITYGQGVYTDNLVMVLDASGSMEKSMRGPHGQVNKMTAAKDAIREVLKTVPESTHVGLLVFSGMGITNEWIHPLGAYDKDVLETGLSRLRPTGTTPLGKYIKIGADRLLEARETQHNYGSYRLLVVTDGQANDENLVNRYTPEVIARGVTLDVIGVAMEERHNLSQWAHSYRSADDPASLQQAIREVMAEVSVKETDSSAITSTELEGLSNEVALAMIAAISEPPNHPVGQGPVASNIERDPPSPSISNRSGGSGSGYTPVDNQPPSRGFSGWTVIVIFIVVFFFVFLKRKTN
ncbi:MAG: VWA domain-containing protein [Planctomycetes bacterium]|nr:VWA domain-containing protein [Planctomycetota bacterium]